jgi:hypothetical protein
VKNSIPLRGAIGKAATLREGEDAMSSRRSPASLPSLDEVEVAIRQLAAVPA